jgi:hypothetical protein
VTFGVLVVATLVCIGITLSVDDVGWVEGVGAAMGTFGPLAVAIALGRWTPRRRLAAADPEPTGSPDTSLVAVGGSIRSLGSPIETPAAEAITVAYVLQRGRKTTRGTNYHTLVEGERSAPMAVDDGSGPLRLDIERLTPRTGIGGGARKATLDLEDGASLPPDVDRFLTGVGVDASTIYGHGGTVDGSHRLKLRYLAAGDVVTAVGDHERVTWATDAFWGLTASTGPCYLFAGELDPVRTQLHRGVYWLGPLGAAVTLGGLGYLASLWMPF